MSADIKLSKTQMPKVIQSGRSSGSLLSKLAGMLMKLVVPPAKCILAPLAPLTISAGIQTYMVLEQQL